MKKPLNQKKIKLKNERKKSIISIFYSDLNFESWRKRRFASFLSSFDTLLTSNRLFLVIERVKMNGLNCMHIMKDLDRGQVSKKKKTLFNSIKITFIQIKISSSLFTSVMLRLYHFLSIFLVCRVGELAEEPNK